MRIDNEIKLDFKDVLLRPKRSTLSSRSGVILERKYKMRCGAEWSGVPIFAANMDSVGTFEMAKALSKHKIITAIHKFYTIKEWIEFYNSNMEIIDYVSISMGATESDLNKVRDVLGVCPKIGMIMIDVANGYTEMFVNMVEKVRGEFPGKILICGNVATGEMVEELIIKGADIVKCGIGPGSVCTTRTTTGVGYPQLSCIIECADAAHGLGGLIIGDGGCTVPGDVVKAFGAGADFVMLGGMLAGHTQSGGKIVGDKMEFYGMSSREAMNKYHGGVAEYRPSEGKCVMIPYRGDVEPTILQILGGLRSGCSYVGANALKELSKRTTFIRVSQQINNVFS